MKSDRNLWKFRIPDVILRFRSIEDSRDLVLIGEAKLRDLQKPSQWAEEWFSYCDQMVELQDGTTVCLLAIDGFGVPLERCRFALESEANEILSNIGETPSINAIACTWDNLLRVSLDEMASLPDDLQSAKRILADLVNALGLHGIRIVAWFGELSVKGKSLWGLRKESMTVLRCWLETPRRGTTAESFSNFPAAAKLVAPVSSLSIHTLNDWRKRNA